MGSSLRTLSLFLSLSLAAASAGSLKYVVHEERGFSTEGSYQKLQTRDHVDATLPVRIGLSQRNLHKGYDFLMAVSHPESHSYGRHWTESEIHETFSPSKESVEAVKQWLVHAGINESRIAVSGATKWLHFDATVQETENLLQTKYHAYTDMKSKQEVISCDQYSVPEHLSEHIDLIHPTIVMTAKHRTHSEMKRRRSLQKQAVPPTKRETSVLLAAAAAKPVILSSDLEICKNTTAPQCIRALYNIPDGTRATPGNELGIAEWTDTLSSADLSLFFKTFTSIPTDTLPSIVTIDGGEHARAWDNDTTKTHIESAVDFQVSYPIIYPQKSILYQVGDDVQDVDFDDLLLAWDAEYYNADGGEENEPDATKYPTPAAALKDSKEPGYKGFQGTKQVGGTKRPTVFSSSYGANEHEYSFKYMNRQCNEYMKLGLMGTSVLYAAGDSGVGSQSGCIPLSKDNATVTAAQAGTSGAFVPIFPAACPYVTAVGGTMLRPNLGVPGGEVVLSVTSIAGKQINLATGGGFSKQFPSPAYQQAAVQAYLKASPPSYNSSIFNASGRAYPDISANALNFNFINFRSFRTTGYGTSIAAPLIAALIVRINEERLALNKTVVGFINPVLYSAAAKSALNDITAGSNPGCGTAGFAAGAGWDPATGLGTPNYMLLAKVFTDLP